ncbi:acyltransferase family protein [Pokkaliibacter sp. CJK22405]|uniref:acyltransferase family protein n=1 Tax=Pokkaliibacter sp. CJK22405 TaxID=3384615 RepID=UPI0039851838
MGSIRTLLAISVVFAHTYGYIFVGGQTAVQLFYIISGYLISYILIEAKSYPEILAFYKNRFLRLFPTYWTVAFITFSLYALASFFLKKPAGPLETFSLLDPVGKIALAVTNITLLGQDWIMFTGVRDGTFEFVGNFRLSDIEVYTGLLAPQAWTLGVELTFYIIAPFILPRRKILFILLFLSLSLRLYFFKIGIIFQDPWSYRFFPTELSFFILGALSHQYLAPWYNKKNFITARNSNTFTTIIFICCAGLFLAPHKNIATLLLLAIFIITLPFLFHFNSQKAWDKNIGELSYPIYISHMLVVMIFNKLYKTIGLPERTLTYSLIIIITTTIFSLIINNYIGKFVEKRRHKIKNTQSFLAPLK